MKIIKWFIESSTNPTKLSLTLKGLLPFLVLLGVDSALLDGFSTNVIDIIVLIGQLLTAFITAWGFARKIALTFWK